MKKYLFVAIPLSIILISQGCNNSIEEPVDTIRISVRGEMFVDDSNRQVILSGINLVNKNPSEGYIGSEGAETFSNFKSWGFNVIRLGIIWDGVEPEPGVYNEEYLQKIDQQIELAKDAGLFVFLDMHQDLFSVVYSDGAPEWATLNEDRQHLKGEIWSDAYLISPAVQTSFDNFWTNRPAPDGLGVQDHYRNAWKHIASRYVDNHTVIGYDIMNEPFPGSAASEFLPLMFNAYADLIGSESGTSMSIEEVASMWSSQETRYLALSRVADKEKFSKVVDAVADLNGEFERELLQDFYQGVAESIREVDTIKILFLEHSYFCNSGVATAINPVVNANGIRDPYVSYAAHGYDLLVDTKNLGKSSTGRLDLIFSRIKESGERMGVPVIIGEWGALGGDNSELTRLAGTNLSFFEKFGFSNTYWAYGTGIEKREYFRRELIRAYPQYLSGNLVGYSNNPDSNIFTCRWDENPEINAPTQIYIPSLVDIERIDLAPGGEKITLIGMDNSPAGYIIIPNSGIRQVREVTVMFSDSPEIDLTQSDK